MSDAPSYLWTEEVSSDEGHGDSDGALVPIDFVSKPKPDFHSTIRKLLHHVADVDRLPVVVGGEALPSAGGHNCDEENVSVGRRFRIEILPAGWNTPPERTISSMRQVS